MKSTLTLTNLKLNKNIVYNLINIRCIYLNNANFYSLANNNEQDWYKKPLILNINRIKSQNDILFNRYTIKSFSTSSNNLNKELTKILTKAEKIVGYGTSFLSLRYLVSDEVANFANLMRKLMQTKHPLIKLARSFISSSESDSKRSLQINGLIVLLISKAAGVPKNGIIQSDLSEGIHISQRRLAEITEMIYMASLIHKGILDLKHVSSTEYKDMDQGNKLAVLCGDYLLANACTNLSKLQNAQVVGLMSEVIGDFSQGIFKTKTSSEKLTYLKEWYDNVYRYSFAFFFVYF
jgi:decaprenyl-diphosphate synthase subunit 2